MSKENNPEDLESTVRLDMREITNPYDDATPPSNDSIEDIFKSTEFSSEPDISYELPEESISFDDLSKEMNELSNEFEDNLQKEKVPQATVKAEKSIEEKAIPKAEATENKRGTTPVKTTTPSTDKKKTETKSDAPATAKKQPAVSHTSKPSNGINLAILGISLIALVAGVTGLWTSMSSQSQIDALTAQLDSMQNNPLNNQAGAQQSELIAVQKQLISLKQDVDSLKVKPKIVPLTDHVPAVVTHKPITKVSPAIVTPAKEVKPTLQKNTWNVVISSHDSMKKAKREQQREVIKGMQTSIVGVVVKGNNWYRIVATGFTDKQQAVNFAHKLKKQGITDAWVQYNK